MLVAFVDNSAAALNFGRFDVAANAEKVKYEALKVWALCRFKQKTLFCEIPLVSTAKQRSVFKGFFAFKAAVMQYGRDNQPNEHSGSAARTSAGGNGGRIIEPARVQSSLLSQAFLPIAGGLFKSVIADATDGSMWIHSRQGQRTALACGLV